MTQENMNDPKRYVKITAIGKPHVSNHKALQPNTVAFCKWTSSNVILSGIFLLVCMSRCVHGAAESHRLSPDLRQLIAEFTFHQAEARNQARDYSSQLRACIGHQNDLPKTILKRFKFSHTLPMGFTPLEGSTEGFSKTFIRVDKPNDKEKLDVPELQRLLDRDGVLQVPFYKLSFEDEHKVQRKWYIYYSKPREYWLLSEKFRRELKEFYYGPECALGLPPPGCPWRLWDPNVDKSADLEKLVSKGHIRIKLDDTQDDWYLVEAEDYDEYNKKIINDLARNRHQQQLQVFNDGWLSCDR